MADSKITALTSISTSTDPANDPLVIVDVSDTSMAATGTTKKVTLNQLLGASGTATLASATITGDLTVDTSTLKVDSANNRVGIGTASPSKPLEVFNTTESTVWANTTTGIALLRAGGTGGDFYFGIDNSTGGGFGQGNYSRLIYSTGAYPIIFSSNASERYRIASDGVATWSNVGGVAGTAMTLNATGLGVGASPATKLDVNGGTGGAGGQNHATFSGNAGRGLVIGTRSDSVSNDRTATLNAPFTGGSIVLQTQGTDRLLVDSSGNVGIGVASPSFKLDVQSTTATFQLKSTTGTNAAYLFTNNTGGDFYFGRDNSTGATFGSGTGYSAILYSAGAYPMAFFTNAIERMRIDASGNLLVGKTATNLQVVGCELKANGTVFSTLVDTTNAAASSYQLYSTGAATYRFYVGMGGTVFATNTTISGISDARLKENVQDIDVGLGAILALKPRKFDWKAGKGKDIKGDRGFIAQEFETVFPNLIDEWKDAAPEGEAPYKSVRQDLIPVLVKAIQELAARVQTLETR